MTPGSEPEWLLDLVMYGPARCTSRPSSDFIAVPFPTFLRACSLRANVLNLDDTREVEVFVKWASRACMGDDLDEPAVQFGYQLDHLWGDCDRMDLAIALVRSDLPSLRTGLASISEDVLGALRSKTG
jgi:hypothetical protein